MNPDTHTFAADLLPEWDVESRHVVTVRASPEVVYQKAREFDLSGSFVIRVLFRLRGLPASALSAEGMRRLRFKPLREEPPRGFALGIIGQFWTLSGHLVDFEPRDFAAFDRPGYAKALWSFELRRLSDGRTELGTSTRIRALDARSRRSFMRYWALIGPFSGLIRNRMLQLVKSAAEEA